MIGNTFDGEIADYIDVASSQAEIIADFTIFIETIIYEVSYRIILERSEMEPILFGKHWAVLSIEMILEAIKQCLWITSAQNRRVCLLPKKG